MDRAALLAGALAFANDPMFWFSAVGAALFRATFATPRTWVVVVTSFAAAMFAACVGTEPLVRRFGLSGGDAWLAAALLSLTGEHLMRFLFRLGDKISTNPDYAVDLFNRWRGKS